MDSIGITHLGVGLTAVAAALIGFNALVRKGPRGTLGIMAACLLTWAAVLPIVMSDPDGTELPRQIELLVVVLRLCGVIGLALGVFDLWQPRESEDRHPIAEWAVRQPVLWGMIVCANFFALLYSGSINSPLLWRYLAGHPVEIVEAAFFFVGMAFLAIRLIDLCVQAKSMEHVTLGSIPVGGQNAEVCGVLLAQLSQLPVRTQRTYLVRRLREAVEFVRRKGSATGLDAHLRHLEELDGMRMYSAYAMLRIIIWAIPILGFLGTVIGITVAIANLSPEALENSMSDVTQGLAVAFDTTAAALALTMVLMFAKAKVEKTESRLLGDVDGIVSQELIGRFQEDVVSRDPNVAVIQRMSQHVLEAVETLAVRQADAWKASIEQTHQQWADVSLATGQIVRDSLAVSLKQNSELLVKALDDGAARHADRLAASAHQHAERLDCGAQQTVGQLRDGLEKLAELLVDALHRHGEVLTAGEKELAQENRQHLAEVQAALGQSMVVATERQEHLVRQSEHLLNEMQIALVEAAGATVRQQEELVRQGDVLLKVVDATGQVRKLEAALNQNLAAVQKAHSFEEMALSLSAAIQLLGARIGRDTFIAPDTQTAGGEAASQAA